MKTIMTEMKNTFNRINSKLYIAEDKVGKLIDTLKEIIKSETVEKKQLIKMKII